MIACAALLALAPPAAGQPAGVQAVPPRRHESTPPKPTAERLVWQPGHWAWDAAAPRYSWHPGRHVIRRLGATRFVPGRWVQTGGDWAWRPARWR